MKSEMIRSSKEFRQLLNRIKARHILMGKKMPSTSKITRMIAKKLNMIGEKEFLNEFIRL